MRSIEDIEKYKKIRRRCKNAVERENISEQTISHK